ncbi:MAG: ABC transporter substrate-binding protein [Actinomycetota bacterium]|nr:ABC transporter substrate-binding protein [Actinomycetota bacterium]
MRRSSWLKSVVAVAGAVGIALGTVSVSGASPASHERANKATGKPIVIGAVIDETSTMKPFDQPALEAAEVWAKKVNAKGGVLGRPVEFKVYNDELQPALTKSDAEKAVAAGAKILWVTCDATFAAPAIEVGLAHHLLTIAPCTSSSEMGPKKFGPAGRLAFSFGNEPSTTGAVIARLLMQKGWKTATVVTDHLLTYFLDVCENFTADYKALGGKIVSQLSYTTGDHTISQVASKAASSGASATVLCTTTTPTLPTFVTSVRTLGNTKPIVGPWSIDGGFWEPKTPKISTNLWWATYASVFGDDPNATVRALYSQMKAEGEAPLTGGFVLGPTALEGIVTAIERTKGSLTGAKLASALVHFHNVPTLSGLVSFSNAFHAVVGRAEAIIEVSNDKPHFVQLLTPGKYGLVLHT